MGRDDLTVPEAAAELGTSPQTVRALLRKGDLGGRKEPWGNRYLWVTSRNDVDAFLAVHGRLDGHRRRRASPAIVATPKEVPPEPPPPVVADRPPEPPPEEPWLFGPDLPPSVPDPSPSVPEPERSPTRPFVLRPRGRATVVVVVVGVPLLIAYGASRILPDALWFDELGQTDVLRRVLAAQAQFSFVVVVSVALFIGVNLAAALRRTAPDLRRVEALGIVGVSLVTGTLFASATKGDWQIFLLWRHRQRFGVADPIHGKDIGYFVFSLPFELLASGILLVLIAVAACFVALVYGARGAIGWRPVHATFGAQLHLAVLAAIFLAVLAWRFRLEQYALELGQPSPRDGQSFSGAGYVDVNVRLPGLDVLTFLAVVLALGCLAAPLVARAGSVRAAKWFVAVPVTLLLVAVALVGALIPALVQRFAVDPNPLLSEQPYLERSIAATRTGLGLNAIDVEAYSPTGNISAADYPLLKKRLRNVLIWDDSLLEARMRQLVTDTPYYSPQESAIDVVRADGRLRPTVVSARELDLGPVGEGAESWISHRLAYTHGLGLIRFSGTEITQNRQPRELDPSLQVDEPRIYFGNEPGMPGSTGADENADEEEEESGEGEDPPRAAPQSGRRTAESPWVLVNTRRPEVDLPASANAPPVPYHYDGPAGVELSSWVHRAVFALALGSKELLLSDDITSDSRILLHRDVHDRLRTLAPFIQWDSHAVPLTSDGQDRLRRRRLHHERELSVRRVRGPRRNLDHLCPGVRSRHRRRVLRCGRPVPDGSFGAHRPSLGGDLPHAVPCGGRDARRPGRPAAIPRRPLRHPGHGLRDVPHHPSRPVRERCRRMVATDRSGRAARSRGRCRLRRVGRGRSPAHHATRVQVHPSARGYEASARAPDLLRPAPRTEPGREPQRLDR